MAVNKVIPYKKKDIIIIEHDSYIVRRAFELYASGAYYMKLLYKKLKDEYDVDWSPSYINKIFKRLQMPKEISAQIVNTLAEVHQNKIEFQNQHFDKLIKEQKELTKMMDYLYLDKLKGKITDEAYDKFYQTFRLQLENIKTKQDRLQEAENNYYIST